MQKLDPITPGELLREEFLEPMGVSQYRLAKEIGVPAQRISEIVAGKRAITADTDLVNDLGFDSLKYIDLVVMLENEHGIVIEEDALAKIKTIRDLHEACLTLA